MQTQLSLHILVEEKRMYLSVDTQKKEEGVAGDISTSNVNTSPWPL
jgi:hypothetical protein